MIALLAETPRDQEMIDRLVEKNRKLKEENERLKSIRSVILPPLE